jgi:hypothetical protein
VSRRPSWIRACSTLRGDPGFLEKAMARIRWLSGDLEDVSGAAVFRSRAADYITGQILWTAHHGLPVNPGRFHAEEKIFRGK